MVVFRQKISKKTCFCFRTWFVLFWLLCFEFCFSVQVCWFLTSRWLFLNNKGNRKEHVFVLEHGLFCYDFCCFNSSFLVSHLKMVVFKQKISDKRMFLFSNMVCFVLIIVFWFLFFSSSLFVSHFKMVVVKWKNMSRKMHVLSLNMFCLVVYNILIFQLKGLIWGLWSPDLAWTLQSDPRT